MPFFKNLFSPPSAAAAEGNQSSHDKAGSTSTGRDERRDSEESAADKHFVPPSLPVEKNDGIKENQSEKIAGINGNSSEKEKLNSGMASLDLFSGLNILSVGSAANEVKREFGQQIGQAKDESEEKAIESTQKNPSAFGFIDGDQENEDIKVNTAPSAFEFMAESGLGDDNQERLLEGTIKTSPEPQETLKSPEFSRSPSELSSKDQRFLAEKSSSSEQENHGGVPTNIEGVSPDPIDEIKHGVEMMENQLSNHINSFESILNSHWRKLQELNAENEIIRRRENNIQMLIEKKQQEILKHEEDQAQHVEAEEFDLADRINCKIEDLKKEICELNEDLCGLDQQLEQSISDRTELTKNTVNQIKLLILEAKSIESINVSHLPHAFQFNI